MPVVTCVCMSRIIIMAKISCRLGALAYALFRWSNVITDSQFYEVCMCVIYLA